MQSVHIISMMPRASGEYIAQKLFLKTSLTLTLASSIQICQALGQFFLTWAHGPAGEGEWGP